MQIHSFDAWYGMVIPMTSPDFKRMDHHCLTFEYETKARLDEPVLEVYARLTDYMLSGDKIWSSEDYISQRNHANVTVQAVEGFRESTSVLDFVGVLAHPKKSSIRLANIGFSSGRCENATYLFGPGNEKVRTCNDYNELNREKNQILQLFCCNE